MRAVVCLNYRAKNLDTLRKLRLVAVFYVNEDALAMETISKYTCQLLHSSIR